MLVLPVLLGDSADSAPHPDDTSAKTVPPPEPVVTHAPSDAQPGQRIEHGELIVDVDEAKRQFNAQHHAYKVLETRRVPGPFHAGPLPVRDARGQGARGGSQAGEGAIVEEVSRTRSSLTTLPG